MKPRKYGDRECPACGGSGYTIETVRDPGAYYGNREVKHECECAREPDYDGPEPDEDRSTGNEEVEW